MHLDRVHRLSSAIETRHIMLNCPIRFYTFIHISTFLSKGKIWTILNKTELAYSAIFSRKSHELFPSLNVSSFSFLPLSNGWDKNKKKIAILEKLQAVQTIPQGGPFWNVQGYILIPAKLFSPQTEFRTRPPFKGSNVLRHLPKPMYY